MAHKKHWIQFGLLFVLALTGCGGSGNGQRLPLQGFYRGVITIQNLTSGNGTGPIVLDVVSPAQYEGHGRTSQAVQLIRDGSDAVLIVNGALITGLLVANSTPGGGFAFRFESAGTVYATGLMDRSSPPALGTNLGIPPAGQYAGDMVVMSNGRVREFGIVAATIESDQTWVAQTQGDSGFVGNALFVGKFEADGTLSNAILSSDGQLVPQSGTTPYSWDGTTLIVRYDTLRLEPGSAWLTLRPVP